MKNVYAGIRLHQVHASAALYRFLLFFVSAKLDKIEYSTSGGLVV